MSASRFRDTVFVDTSAWVALASKRDRMHFKARDYWQRLEESRRFLLTNDYVLDETYTLLRRTPGGLALAVAFHELVTTSAVIEVEAVTEDLQRRAWMLFAGYDDKVLSFTDCVSFAHMRQRDLFEAFAFDDDFRRAGFLVRP